MNLKPLLRSSSTKDVLFVEFWLWMLFVAIYVYCFLIQFWISNICQGLVRASIDLYIKNSEANEVMAETKVIHIVKFSLKKP